MSGSNNDYYPALNTYNLDSKYAFGGSLNSGYYQRKYRLETISWEKASTWGVGVDFTLFNKLNGSLDYYNRKTTGIIMDVTVPKEFALDAYKDNVGSMRNSGIEINLSYNTKIGQVDFGIAGISLTIRMKFWIWEAATLTSTWMLLMVTASVIR